MRIYRRRETHGGTLTSSSTRLALPFHSGNRFGIGRPVTEGPDYRPGQVIDGTQNPGAGVFAGAGSFAGFFFAGAGALSARSGGSFIVASEMPIGF